MGDYSRQIIDIKHNNRLSNKQLAEMLGVSMHSVQAWCTGRRNPSKTMIKHIDSIFDTHNQERTKEMDRPMVSAEEKSNEQLLINLQQEKINALNEQVAHYEELLKNPSEGIEFDALSFDLRTEVEIKFSFSGIKRRMTKMDNGYKKIAKMLDLSPDKMAQLYAKGEWYPMNAHPVNKIIEKNNLKRLQHLTKTLPERFETLKNITGDHYVSEPIVYSCNGKKVHTWVHCKIYWGLKVKVDCKTQIVYE